MDRHEIEIKLGFDDKEKVISKFKEIGAEPKSREEIIDVYYSRDSDNLKDSKEFIRIRRNSGKSELTFKGAVESKGDIWKRVELNSEVSDPDIVEEIFLALGFKEVRRNRSARNYFQIGDVEGVIIEILEPGKVKHLELEGPDDESVDGIVKKLGDCVRPLDEGHFKVLDES